MHCLLNTLLGISTALADSSNSDAVTQTTSKTAGQIQGIFDLMLQFLPLWITGFLVIVISFFLSKIVKSAVEAKMTEKGIEEEHREIQLVTGRAASTIVLTIGTTAGLKIAGLDLTPIITAGAFGIGFAMKDIIMNFLAGIIVLLQKQFTIGDWVNVGGTQGVIKEIQSRYTIIKQFDGTKAIVPNSDLFKKKVINMTGYQFRRFQFDLGVDLYVDLKEAIALIYKSISKVKSIMVDPKPSIIVTQPGSYYNNLRIRCWVDARKGVLQPSSSLIKQIHKDFYKKGWSWPFPIQTLIMDKDDKPNVANRAEQYVKDHKKKGKKTKNAVTTTLKLGGNNVPPVVSPNMTPSWLQKAENAATAIPGSLQLGNAPLGDIITPQTAQNQILISQQMAQPVVQFQVIDQNVQQQNPQTQAIVVQDNQQNYNNVAYYTPEQYAQNNQNYADTQVEDNLG